MNGKWFFIYDLVVRGAPRGWPGGCRYIPERTELRASEERAATTEALAIWERAVKLHSNAVQPRLVYEVLLVDAARPRSIVESECKDVEGSYTD